MKKIKPALLLLFILCLFFISCRKRDEERVVKINFSHTEREGRGFQGAGSSPPLTAAVSAMVSPEENFFSYSQIFDYLSKEIGREITFKQRNTYYEVNELLRRQEVDFAFICSGAYVEAKRNFGAEILVRPQINGKTFYHAYVIVRRDSGLEKFEDLKGKDFAFTDPLSNTGCLYPKYLLKQMNLSEEDFLSNVIYTYAHDYAIQAVANRIVTAASVDSLIFEYIQRNMPQETRDLKIINKSLPFGIPPVVVHPRFDARLKEKLRSVFLSLHLDSEGREILDRLDIDRFVLGEDRDYDSIRMMKNFIQRERL